MKLFLKVCIVFLVLTSCKEHTQISPVDLSGNWKFCTDPDNVGEDQKWFSEIGSQNWEQIRIPSSFNAVKQDLLWYRGTVWYQVSFTVPSEWPAGRLFLHFLGVSTRSRIWLNGHEIGSNLFPYTGFKYDITDVAQKTKENILTVCVDNKILEKSIPDNNWNGWWNFGGIYRQVFLEYEPSVFIRDARIVTEMQNDNKWKLDLDITLNNTLKRSNYTLEFEVTDKNGESKWKKKVKKDLPAGQSNEKSRAVFENITGWSPGEPALYNLVIKLAGKNDIYCRKDLKFGFRQIAVKDDKILLNGKPIQIYGISRQELYPGTGHYVSSLRTKMDLEDIKSLGCNLLRMTHYPNQPLVFDLCDEMGLLVWCEFPAWKTGASTLADTDVWAQYGEPQLTQMVRSFQNHPSVVIWSLGNDLPTDKIEGVNYIDKAYKLLKKLDPSRLVTFASDKNIKDLAFKNTDIISINSPMEDFRAVKYIGEMLDKVHKTWPEKPVLVSKAGGEAVFGWRNTNTQNITKDYTEDYQIYCLSQYFETIFDPTRKEYVSGLIITGYADFPAPNKIASGHPPLAAYVNCSGLVTQDRQKKRAFDFVRKYFSSLSDEK